MGKLLSKFGMEALRVMRVVALIVVALPMYGDGAWVGGEVQSLFTNRYGSMSILLPKAPSDPPEGSNRVALRACTSRWVVLEKRDPIASQRMFDMAKQAVTLKQRVSLYLVEPPASSASKNCIVSRMQIWPL